MSATLSRDTRLRPTSQLLTREVDGEAVVLDLAAGTYFGLNEVATATWHEISAERPLGEIHAVLAAAFDAAPVRLWDDLLGLVSELERLGLVERLGEH